MDWDGLTQQSVVYREELSSRRGFFFMHNACSICLIHPSKPSMYREPIMSCDICTSPTYNHLGTSCEVASRARHGCSRYTTTATVWLKTRPADRQLTQPRLSFPHGPQPLASTHVSLSTTSEQINTQYTLVG